MVLLRPLFHPTRFIKMAVPKTCLLPIIMPLAQLAKQEQHPILLLPLAVPFVLLVYLVIIQAPMQVIIVYNVKLVRKNCTIDVIYQVLLLLEQIQQVVPNAPLALIIRMSHVNL